MDSPRTAHPQFDPIVREKRGVREHHVHRHNVLAPCRPRLMPHKTPFLTLPVVSALSLTDQNSNAQPHRHRPKWCAAAPSRSCLGLSHRLVTPGVPVPAPPIIEEFQWMALTPLLVAYLHHQMKWGHHTCRAFVAWCVHLTPARVATLHSDAAMTSSGRCSRPTRTAPTMASRCKTPSCKIKKKTMVQDYQDK